jgi:hypothetical protein
MVLGRANSAGLRAVITALERAKLASLVKQYAGEFQFCPRTSEEALVVALELEQTCRELGPFDTAYSHFKQQQLDMEAFALLYEKAANR